MVLLERRKLSHKLALGFVVVGLMTLIIAGVSIHYQNVLRRSIRTVYTQHLLALDDLGNAHFEALKMGRGLRNLLLSKDPAEQKASEKYVLEAEAGVHRYMDRARTHLSENDLALLPAVENRFAVYEHEVHQLLDLFDNGRIADAQAFI